MDRQELSQARSSAAAVEAAVRLAARLGINGIDPRIVCGSPRRVCVRLYPLDVVARVADLANDAIAESWQRELAVARHLEGKSAPIVAPATELPAGPHFENGYGLTLWQFVSHIAANANNPQHVQSAAEALRAIHDALADYSEELPLFWTKLGECRALLENGSALPELRAADRAFLLATYDTLRASLARCPMNFVPIHGDAHIGNVLITHEGARWTDFEDVCLGPREWDLGWLANANLARFEPVSREALLLLRTMRSLCVSVWCWALFDRPEKREAAEYHLGRLKEHFAQPSRA